MIYSRGNKIIPFVVASIFIFCTSLLSLKIYEKKMELNLNKKRLEIVQDNLAKSNKQIITGENI